MKLKIQIPQIEMNERNLKLFILISGGLIFSLIIAVTAIQLTMYPQFCSLCHEMKPEYYTYKASSHNNIQCTNCHIEPGVKNLVVHKVSSLKEVFKHITGTYYSPIQMNKPINNEVCITCHNMDSRKVTPTGDLIIPHKTHEEKGILCSKCHSGVAHGNIANRRITFAIDIDKWNETLGVSVMNDDKYVRPSMDLCMNCHQQRKAPLNCGACHTTGMLPDSHKTEPFKNGGHGKLAAKNLFYCDSCHSFMSYEKVKGLEKKPSYVKFLEKDQKQLVISVDSYAKENTFCRDCHSKKPPSHRVALFLLNHGQEGDKNTKRCLTCHEFNPVSVAPVASVACNSCHPSLHGKQWQPGHYPFKLPNPPRIIKDCFNCHSQETCSKCHTDALKIKLN